MYRGVTWKALHNALDFENKGAISEMAWETTISLMAPADLTGKQHVLVDGIDVTAEIRLPEVSSNVSGVAAIPAVRQVLTAQQQAMGAYGGVVMDGRDIGTAVFPFAEVKVYLTASTRERTRRRWQELMAQGIHVDLAGLEQDIAARDLADSNREVAPLRPAEDAVIVHSDDQSIDNVVDAILAIVEEKRQQRLATRG
jgi:cytidylate kinase